MSCNSLFFPFLTFALFLLVYSSNISLVIFNNQILNEGQGHEKVNKTFFEKETSFQEEFTDGIKDVWGLEKGREKVEETCKDTQEIEVRFLKRICWELVPT